MSDPKNNLAIYYAVENANTQKKRMKLDLLLKSAIMLSGKQFQQVQQQWKKQILKSLSVFGKIIFYF